MVTDGALFHSATILKVVCQN